MPKTFILADDDIDDIDIFRHALKEIDRAISCREALNGLQLLNTLLESPNPKPDIIFLDINMPVMNGWKCLEALKAEERTKDIPVIIYTTSDQLMEEKKAREMGALCFIQKYSNFEQLKKMLSIVRDHIERNALERLREAIPFKFT